MWHLRPGHTARLRSDEVRKQIYTPLAHESPSAHYVFAELLGRKDKLKYNREILYLSAIMHDLGLTDEFAGSQRFELDGADAARWFLMRQGVPRARIGLVWNAISFHTSSGIYDRMKSEIALLGFGALADVTGARVEEIPAQKVQGSAGDVAETRVQRCVSEADRGDCWAQAANCDRRFRGDVLRQRGIAVPTVCEVMEAAPF